VEAEVLWCCVVDAVVLWCCVVDAGVSWCGMVWERVKGVIIEANVIFHDIVII
jgi:hypothetical protein